MLSLSYLHGTISYNHINSISISNNGLSSLIVEALRGVVCKDEISLNVFLNNRAKIQLQMHDERKVLTPLEKEYHNLNPSNFFYFD